MWKQLSDRKNMDPFDLEILWQQRSVMLKVKWFCLNMLFNGKADAIENTKLLTNVLPIAFYCVIKPYLPQVIYRCTSEAWINVSDILTFCSGNVNTEYHNPASEGGGAAVGGDTPSSTSTGGLSGGCPNTTERSANDNSITFIISAEGTSWKHLYLVTSKIYPSGCVNQSNEKEFFDGKEMVAKKIIVYILQNPLWHNKNSYICFLAVVRNVHCLFYMGPVGHSKSN